MSWFAFAYGLASTVIALLLIPGTLQPDRSDDRPILAFGVSVGLLCGLVGFAAWARLDALPLHLNIGLACALSLALAACVFHLLTRRRPVPTDSTH